MNAQRDFLVLYEVDDLSVLTDAERQAALIEIAHPDFRAELRAAIG